MYYPGTKCTFLPFPGNIRSDAYSRCPFPPFFPVWSVAMSRRLLFVVLTLFAAAMAVSAAPTMAQAHVCNPGAGIGPC